MLSYRNFDNYECFISKCKSWLYTPELDILVEQFENRIPRNLAFTDRLDWLADFSQIWDFRKIQSVAKDLKTGETARWLLSNSNLNEMQMAAAIKAAEALGMITGQALTNKNQVTILVLGGARMSCLFRMRFAKELCESYGIRAKEIVGLTGMRLISDSERSTTDTYAPEAKTEFDLMCEAAKRVFGLSREASREGELLDSLNDSWARIRYKSKIPITILAAPSSEPEKRRANTADTFQFWREQRDAEKENSVLLVTSQIYVPYQQLEAVRILGIPYGYNLETVGFPREWSVGIQGLQTAANYLQEIRSVLLSMQKLFIKKI